MTTDELKALLDGATPGPWEAVLDVFWRVYVADGGDYAGQCVGDMNESAAMWRSPSDEQPDDFAEANARLIALAPDLLAEVIALRERQARLVEALREATEITHKAYVSATMEAVNAGPSHPLAKQMEAWRMRCLKSESVARAALAEIENGAGNG